MAGLRRNPALLTRTAIAALLFVSALPLLAQQPTTQRRALPTRIADTTFWRISTSFSEPGGYFQSENFTSNEAEFPFIVTTLMERGRQGGAYIGVGPEQNFHYIAALRPQIVFQLDIRRQAIIQHLMYKAIFELSADRADFISLLFSKPRPRRLTRTSSIDSIWKAYWFVPTDSNIYPRNLARITNHLTRTHRFALSTEDRASLAHVYEAFYSAGPSISYSGGAAQVTFTFLTTRTDSGIPRSFLATEETFRYLKDLHTRNLIIPVVGDFSGPKAITAVARFLADHGTTLNAFYVSNVEYYLFAGGTSSRFYANVAALPLDSSSIFIRPGAVVLGRSNPVIDLQNMRLDTLRMQFGTGTGAVIVARRAVSPTNFPAPATQTAFVGGALCPIQSFLAAQAFGRVLTFQDANRCAR